jgi:hypothetical protein
VNLLRKLIAKRLKLDEQVVRRRYILLVLDGQLDPNQVANDAHGDEPQLRILLGLSELDGLLEARPAEFLKLVPFLDGWEPGDPYRHLVGEHEAFDGTIEISV